MCQIRYYFWIRNYRPSFGKIDLRGKKELGLREQIQWINNSMYHYGLIAGGILGWEPDRFISLQGAPSPVRRKQGEKGNQVREFSPTSLPSAETLHCDPSFPDPSCPFHGSSTSLFLQHYFSISIFDFAETDLFHKHTAVI